MAGTTENFVGISHTLKEEKEIYLLPNVSAGREVNDYLNDSLYLSPYLLLSTELFNIHIIYKISNY